MNPAFTLLEIVIVLALIALLVGIAAENLRGSLEETQIKENAGRMASLLRSLRAEAANTGRRHRLSFDAETGQPVVEIEPKPLEEPGEWQGCGAWWVKLGNLSGGVQVAVCERTGAAAFLPATASPGSAEESDLDTIYFHPDGSSDSARIVLLREDEDRPWAAEVTLNGVDGTISTRQIDLENEEIDLQEASP